MKERFRKICDYLEFTEGEELFDNFDACLSDNAETQWENITFNLEDRSIESFNHAYDQLVLQYCGRRARDDMVDYLTKK